MTTESSSNRLLVEYEIGLTFNEDIGKSQKGSLEKCKKAEKLERINAHPDMTQTITKKELKVVETNDYSDFEDDKWVEYTLVIHRWIEIPQSAIGTDEWGDIEINEKMIPKFEYGTGEDFRSIRFSDYYPNEQTLLYN